ncbi:hypothetical protein DSM21852_03990 [Methylocystis bryophila]|nr:hypothetical protein DSM21852_03990 [Methylocystis bryophila]
MRRKRPTPEEIVAKLRQVDVLVSKGKSVASPGCIKRARRLKKGRQLSCYGFTGGASAPGRGVPS